MPYRDPYGRFRTESYHELSERVIARKEALWGQGDRKYSPQRSARNVINPPIGNPPSPALLKWAANATDAELMAKAGNRDPDYGFLYYK